NPCPHWSRELRICRSTQTIPNPGPCNWWSAEINRIQPITCRYSKLPAVRWCDYWQTNGLLVPRGNGMPKYNIGEQDGFAKWFGGPKISAGMMYKFCQEETPARELLWLGLLFHARVPRFP